MKFDRNEKLVLLLSAVLVASLSPLQKAKSAASREFASESSSTSIADCIERARNGSSDDCEVQKSDNQKQQDTIKLTNLRITAKGELEGSAVAVVKCTECKVEETSSAIDLRAIPVKDIAKINQRLQQAKKEATGKFKDALAQKKKELGCEVDEDGETIDATNSQAKLECFKTHLANLDDKDRQKYLSTYVEPYFKDHVELGISQQALNGNPYAAHTMAAQWRQLGLGDPNITSKINLIDTVSQTRIQNLIYQSNTNMIAMQNMAGLMSNDPAVHRAALARYNQQINANATNHFVTLMNAQTALGNAMGGMTATDSTMSSLGTGMMMQLNQNVQGMINSNKSLASTLGPNFVNSGLGNSFLGSGNSLFGNSFGVGGLNTLSGAGLFGGSGLVGDPLSMNSNLGLTSNLNLALNNNSSAWSQYPQWGSNVAVDNGTSASFSTPAAAPTTTNTPTIQQSSARMTTPSLKRIN